MVGMFVCVEDRMDDADLLTQQLLSQVRRRVDEQIARRQAQSDPAARAAVTRVVASAD